jgi:hypothetical protein
MVMKRASNKLVLTFLLAVFLTSFSSAIVINEFSVDPQTDWDKGGSIGSSDEWVELYNPGDSPVDLTNWTLFLIDSTNATEVLSGTIQAFEYRTILDPNGTQNNDGEMQLYDSLGTLVDSVTYGNWNDGNVTDNGPTGNANSPEDECLARIPNGQDTNWDFLDFIKTTCTYNKENKILESNEQGLGVIIAGKIVMKILPRWLDFGVVQPGSINNSALNGPIIFNATGSEADVNVEITEVIGLPFVQGLKIDGKNSTGLIWTMPISSPVKTAIPTLDVPEDADAGSSEGTIIYTITGQA